MQAIRDIFDIWDSLNEMAKDLGALPDTILRWRLRGRIPEDAWPKIIAGTAKRKKPVTAEQLMELNAPIKKRGRPRGRRSRKKRVA